MSTLRDFSADPILRGLLADKIAAAFSETDDIRPDVGDVIADALSLARAAIRDRAEDMASCYKVDDCRAQAIVLFRLADWIEEATL